MSTLGIMKERIASELRRDDLSSASEFRVLAANSDIHDAIHSAIDAYQHIRFWFNEARTITFTTVADQDLYDESDDVDIPLILKFDYAVITVGGGIYELTPLPPNAAEVHNGGFASPGQPEWYTYYGEQIRLTPTPVEADWVVRIGCLIKRAAPAEDNEASNVWMTHAERLIRARAKAELYLHVIKDMQQAQTQRAIADDALQTLKDRTAQVLQMGDLNVEAWD
jgi:hypothetical protein